MEVTLQNDWLRLSSLNSAKTTATRAIIADWHHHNLDRNLKRGKQSYFLKQDNDDLRTQGDLDPI